jgi:hypothetical protein
VQVPEQVVIERGAHPDEPLAVIDQQPDVEFDAGQLRDRQPLNALPERRSGDGDGVDAVGPAAIAPGAALVGHQPRRDPDHALAVDEQKPLEGTGDMATVLKRPHALVAQAAGPLKGRREPAVTDLDSGVPEQLAGARGDGSQRVRALVHVRTEHDHDLRPFHPI